LIGDQIHIVMWNIFPNGEGIFAKFSAFIIL